ncbi:hypothetical protein [Hydrogenimonas sp.]
MRRFGTVAWLVAAAALHLAAADVQCRFENEKIVCTYFLDRSDNPAGRSVLFHWVSPRSPEDDRIRHFDIPPRYGSVYDYRFLPGRVRGEWRVVVTDLESNESVETIFDINGSDETLFEEE